MRTAGALGIQHVCAVVPDQRQILLTARLAGANRAAYALNGFCVDPVFVCIVAPKERGRLLRQGKLCCWLIYAVSCAMHCESGFHRFAGCLPAARARTAVAGRGHAFGGVAPPSHAQPAQCRGAIPAPVVPRITSLDCESLFPPEAICKT